MSDAAQFFGGGSRRVAQVFNGTTTYAMATLPGAVSYTLNATGTTNQWQTVLSVTGSGRLNCAAIAQRVASSAIAIRVTLDGVVIATRTGSGVLDRGIMAIGFPMKHPDSDNINVLGFTPQPIDFAQSLLIEAQTSLASPGTPAATVFAAYEVNVA